MSGDKRLAPAAAWLPPAECDVCPHPISRHYIWEPDEGCTGWMTCEIEPYDGCWHSYPALLEEVPQ
jgi:hypothetical protein